MTLNYERRVDLFTVEETDTGSGDNEAVPLSDVAFLCCITITLHPRCHDGSDMI